MPSLSRRARSLRAPAAVGTDSLAFGAACRRRHGRLLGTLGRCPRSLVRAGACGNDALRRLLVVLARQRASGSRDRRARSIVISRPIGRPDDGRRTWPPTWLFRTPNRATAPRRRGGSPPRGFGSCSRESRACSRPGQPRPQPHERRRAPVRLHALPRAARRLVVHRRQADRLVASRPSRPSDASACSWSPPAPWFTAELTRLEWWILPTLGSALSGLWTALAICLLLAFPQGRLRSRIDRLLVAAIVLDTVVLQLVGPSVFADDRDGSTERLRCLADDQVANLIAMARRRYSW